MFSLLLSSSLLLCLLLVSRLCVHHGCELSLNVLDLRLKSLLIRRSLVLRELLHAFCALVTVDDFRAWASDNLLETALMNVLTRKLV